MADAQQAPLKAHLTYRVPYADTDQMGVVYYSNYLVYFERLRNELLREAGLPYKDIEQRGFALPVIEAHVNYRASAAYDDELDICGWFVGMRRTRLRVDCTVSCNDVLLAEGYTVHACVDINTLRPVRIIPELLACCGARD